MNIMLRKLTINSNISTGGTNRNKERMARTKTKEVMLCGVIIMAKAGVLTRIGERQIFRIEVAPLHQLITMRDCNQRQTYVIFTIYTAIMPLNVYLGVGTTTNIYVSVKQRTLY